MQGLSWLFSSKSGYQFACLVYFACNYLVYEVSAVELLDIQRQQLPFGELVFPVPERVDNASLILDRFTPAAIPEVNLPKITAMIDRHTDDGSVISRHYSATLVESAWRNRINNSTLEFFLENTKMDVSSLSMFAACYLSSILLMAVTKKV